MAKQEMTWDSRDERYHGMTSDGREIVVEGVEYAEAVQDAARDGLSESQRDEYLNDPDVWETCIGGNQNVEYVK